MKDKLKILTDGWGEILIYQLRDNIKFDIERLNKGILGKKSFDGGDLKNAFIMRKFEKNQKYGIIHYNNWLDPIVCKFPKEKITIFESHSIHIGLNLRNALNDLETIPKKFLGIFIHFIYKIIFKYKIRKIDIYMTSIPSVLPYAQKYKKEAIWLPNAVDFGLFEKKSNEIILDPSYINIFLPSGVRIRKNQKKCWQIIDQIFKRHPRVQIYAIKHRSSNYNLIAPYLKKYAKNIIWLPIIEREKISNYYSSKWDLVLGSMWPKNDYAMLNMIELELMASKSPIVAMDMFEVIKVPYEEIDSLAFKVLEDKKYRKWYIERNYNYVKDVHSLESVASLYSSTLGSLNNKNNI